MKRFIAILITIVMIAATIGLTACGASAASTKEYKMDYAVAETAAAAYAEEAAMDYGAYDLAQVPASGTTTGFNGESGSTEVANPNRKLIKDVYLELETKEYEALTSSITEKVRDYGGYIENSSSTSPSVNDYGYNQSRHMNITARIPSDDLDDFVAGVSTLGNLTYKSENVTDITLQYTDTESRKKSLLAEQQRLNELMKKAETVEDLIAIEARLSEVRYQLESIESQLRTYDNQVDYSTVNIGISEVVDYTPQTEATLGEKISEGFTSCIHGLGTFFEGLLVFIIAYSPALLLIAAAVVAVVLIVKKCRKKKSKKTDDPIPTEEKKETAQR